MKALIFAAGRGERLKPLTDHTPKPLVQVHDKPLIQYHIEALMKAGITEVVINVSWLKEQIIEFMSQLCAQQQFSALQVNFSIEADFPLETGGGMLKALPILGDEPFVVVNADVFTDFDFKQLRPLAADQLLSVVLVTNPEHNSDGDFSMVNDQLALTTNGSQNFTYAGIGLYHPKLLARPAQGNEFPAVFSIVPHIKAAISTQQAGAQLHLGSWHDVGTLTRLAALSDASSPQG
jgi:MurNAc alpha-1-phosphate uridylyltransferase